jgi:hypothetical protein
MKTRPVIEDVAECYRNYRAAGFLPQQALRIARHKFGDGHRLENNEPYIFNDQEIKAGKCGCGECHHSSQN